MLAIFLGACGWQMWSIHKYNAAVREAKDAGFRWEFTDIISLIRQDWRNALKKETWGTHQRKLYLIGADSLTQHRELIRRLRPTELSIDRCNDENLDALKKATSLQLLTILFCDHLQNLDALKGVTGLQTLQLYDCPELQNVDGLSGLTGLHDLTLNNCRSLHNADALNALSGLTGLQTLFLYNCLNLQNVNALRRLTGLQYLYLDGWPELQSVDALKNLTGLKELDLHHCDKIPAAALRELRAALPKTKITFPDSSREPPQ